jgi:hypothetical protein
LDFDNTLDKCHWFGFCDPYQFHHRKIRRRHELDTTTNTLPISPFSDQQEDGDEPLLVRDVTVAIHHHQHDRPGKTAIISTPHRWQSTTVSTISPLTSPRELRHQHGTHLESSRRQLFHNNDDDDEADELVWIGSSWKFMLWVLLPFLVCAMYGFKGSAVSLISTRVGETAAAAAAAWRGTIPWSIMGSKTVDVVSKDIDARTAPSTFPDSPIIHSLAPVTPTGSPNGDSDSSSTFQPLHTTTTTTLQSLQQPRLILTPLARTLRPSFRSFLDHQFRERGHWILPLASTIIPGMGWVLIMAIVARLVILGTPSL